MSTSPFDPLASLWREAEAAMQAGDFRAAHAKLVQALREFPPRGELLYLRAVCAVELGDYRAALADLDAAQSLIEPFADIHFRRGVALHLLDDVQGALASFEQALRLDADHLPSLRAAGQMLAQQPRRAAEAVARLDRLLALSPEAEAFNNRAVAQRDLDRLAESLADTGQALALVPELAEAWWNRGSALHDLGRLQEAITAFRRAAELQPQQAGAQQQVCFISRVICQWASLQHDDADLLRRLQQPGPLKVSTFGLIAVAAIPTETLADVAKRAAPLLIGPLLQHSPLVAPGSWRPRERLRIGYLSADFYDHATVRLLAGVLEQHDRERFVVHGYSYGNIRDEGTARVAAISDVFHHLPEQTDEAIAAQIFADEVDILVDLKGPTQHMRPQISARRPAPVIVNWLGYPGTFGHPRLADYLIGDAVVTPLEHARFYSETLALMPQGYQPNDRTRELGARPSRGDVGLPETGFVFGSFNQTYKIDPATFAVWMRLLHALPGSVLWQLESHPDAAANLRREAAAAGIDPQRIVFAPKLGQTPHLGRLQLVDLALDTFPCNGHTTTSDALWAGVPVITRIGETFASRVAASILHSIGLDELITTNEADYFACALAWARTPSALLALRSRIERNRLRSPLFDTPAFTRDLEKIYARMWEQQRRGVREAIVIEGAAARSATID